MIFWYQKLISDIRKSFYDIRKSISDIRKSISDIRKSISDIRKCVNFWYQKIRKSALKPIWRSILTRRLLLQLDGFGLVLVSWFCVDRYSCQIKRTNQPVVLHGHQEHEETRQFLHKMLPLTIALLLAYVLSTDAKQPHILLIIADDLGFNDVGYHNPDIISPTIDKLAKEGVRLENYYVQPICSPSRSQLLSGRYQVRQGNQSCMKFGYYGEAVANMPWCTRSGQ